MFTLDFLMARALEAAGGGGSRKGRWLWGSSAVLPPPPLPVLFRSPVLVSVQLLAGSTARTGRTGAQVCRTSSLLLQIDRARGSTRIDKTLPLSVRHNIHTQTRTPTPKAVPLANYLGEDHYECRRRGRVADRRRIPRRATCMSGKQRKR